MIVFVSAPAHGYTHKWVARRLPFVRRTSYPVLFARRRLPIATYIFGDFDRLTFWQLEYAADLFRSLREAGCRVLNDPARVLQRLALLRRLRRSEVNTFGAWSALDAEDVDRYPVFLRTAAAHRGVIGELIDGPSALEQAVSREVAAGRPLSDLIVVEHRAQPLYADLYRKLAMYKVGDALVPAPSVHERKWSAKYGELGVASEEAYADDLAQIREVPHAELLSRAFALAAIDYGRADYGLVDGRPEIYEINTNPTVSRSKAHPSPSRRLAVQHSQQRYDAALQALDTGARGEVAVSGLRSRTAIPKRYRLAPGYLWTP